MIQYKRRNTIWLAVLSVLTLLVLISGNVAADVQALMLGLFTLALAGSFISPGVQNKLVEALQQRSPLNRVRATAEAREAAARAQSRSSWLSTGIQLADVGLITAQSSRDGLAMRRTRTISKDDDGVRPFVVLMVAPEDSERSVNVRFEIIDHTGKEQYVHNMRVYLREGEVNVLAENHLPLIGNDHIAGIGEWDLRVYINEDLIAMHNFSLTASVEERRQRLRGQYYVTESEREQDSREIPLSLEELLRNQGRSDSRN